LAEGGNRTSKGTGRRAIRLSQETLMDTRENKKGDITAKPKAGASDPN